MIGALANVDENTCTSIGVFVFGVSFVIYLFVMEGGEGLGTKISFCTYCSFRLTTYK